MDFFEWCAYWIVAWPLAVGVVLFGTLTAIFIALIWGWQYIFSKPFKLDSCPLCPHSDGEK